MKNYSIQKGWEEYLAAVLGNGYSQMQYAQLYMTFIAGILFTISTLTEINQDKNFTEEQKEEVYLKFTNECLSLHEKFLNEMIEKSKKSKPEWN